MEDFVEVPDQPRKVVEVRGLHKSFSDGETLVQVLQDVSFRVHQGESLAITGPSGSGKSTLLNILAGTLSADAGDIRLQVGDTHAHPGDAHAGDTQLVWQDTPSRHRTRVRRRHIGYVHQFFNLIPTLTVFENVCLPARLNKRKDLHGHATQLLTQFGLAARLRVFPETLSGGEQQRVAVARALLLAPALLLADEPTGNLDQQNSTQVAELLFSAAARSGAALVIATHSEQVAGRAQHRLHLGN